MEHDPPTVDGRLGSYLIEHAGLEPGDLERTLKLRRGTGQSLGVLLARTGLVSDEHLCQAYASVLGHPLLNDADIPEEGLQGPHFKVAFLREARIVPLSMDEESLTVATSDPENTFALKALEMATGRALYIRVASAERIENVLDRLYERAASDSSRVNGEHREDETTLVERLRHLAAEAPVVRLVNRLVQRAIEARASDIHIEPFERRLKVRYRIDGVLKDVEAPPAGSAAAVVSRVKLMASMNIAERRLPQDGRIQVRVQGKVVDLRTSTVPTAHGESVVLRVLDQERVALDIGALGLGRGLERGLQDVLKRPHGIVLVTGPTGSGKTTTLYAALQALNRPDRKILTVEDPVEYQLEGINQIQVKPRIGLDFANALRAIVRQDPDIIMIGEMRDIETAGIAIQSALTGHLVFSTLHTNNAVSAVTRLLDMGVEDYLLTSTVNAVLAQRLARRLCPACKTEYRPQRALVRSLGLDRLAANGDPRLLSSVGCGKCEQTGYRGRLPLAEFLVLTDPIRAAVMSRCGAGELQRLAVNHGMQTMKVDGLRKALAGLTTIEEVARIADA
ncbi:MAG: type II secretion system ATPase GspE [Rhodospirillaceae bacterium]|nr:type II secretion system ATPase GspE [Rhodospirillaceae bacterium]